MKMITILKNNLMISITTNGEKLHISGWKNSYFTSADLYMLGYGCSVSQYPQFCDKDLDMYQVLPRPHIGYFNGYLGDKLILKNGC